MLQPVEKVHRFVQLVESRNIARRDIKVHTIAIFFVNRHFYLSLFTLAFCDANQGIIHRVIGPHIPLRLKNVLIISSETDGSARTSLKCHSVDISGPDNTILLTSDAFFIVIN